MSIYIYRYVCVYMLSSLYPTERMYKRVYNVCIPCIVCCMHVLQCMYIRQILSILCILHILYILYVCICACMCVYVCVNIYLYTHMLYVYMRITSNKCICR